MNSFMRFVNVINEAVGKCCSLLVAPMMGIIVLELVLRFIFASPTNWVHESSGYMLAFYSILGGGYALQGRGHVNVDILLTRFTRRKQRLIALFTWLVFFFYLIVIIWYSGEASIFSIKIWEHSSSAWGPLYWPVRLVIPIGSILMFLQGLVQFIEDLTFVLKREEEVI